MLKQVISSSLCLVLLLSCLVVSFADSGESQEAPDIIGKTVLLGHYEQDNNLSNGKERIEWIVLDADNEKALLISRYALDVIPYHFYKNNYWCTYWEYSEMRRWLNGSFLSLAFTFEEQKNIISTSLDNSRIRVDKLLNFHTDKTTIGEKNTLDRIFLLSCSEVLDYFEDPSTRICQATTYAEDKVEYMHDSGNYAWWLRTPIDYRVFIVQKDGSFYTVNSPDQCAVRPAMWVDIDSVIAPLPEEEPEAAPFEFTPISCDTSITADTVLGDTAWKLWIPEGFTADELTEADLAENYIGYYLRDDDIIAVQYYDNAYNLADWQSDLLSRGFTIKGLYEINGHEAILYQNEDEDFLTASVLDANGKLLEVSFYPYSQISDEADTVISSIQQDVSKRRLSGAASSSPAAGTGGTGGNSAIPASSLSSEVQAQQYHEMVAAYKEGRYQDCYQLCEKLGDYEDAALYTALLKVRLCYTLELKDSDMEDLLETIVKHMDLEDARDALVCNSFVAHYYLMGMWRNNRGNYTYEETENGGRVSTVPIVPYSGDSSSIVDGILYRYFDGDWDNRTPCYKFMPISRNSMDVYAYQTKEVITLDKKY